MPGGCGTPVRHSLRQPGMGRAGRRHAEGKRGRRLCGSGVPARRDNRQREGTRGPWRHRRRRSGDRRGNERRRAEGGRPRRGPARHRGGDGRVPERRRAVQGHHRSGAVDRGREGVSVHNREGGRRRFRQDVNRLWPGRRDRRRCRADASCRRQQYGSEGLGRHSRSGDCAGNACGGRHAPRDERGGEDRAGRNGEARPLDESGPRESMRLQAPRLQARLEPAARAQSLSRSRSAR